MVKRFGSMNHRARSANALLTATYWEMGRCIVEFQQGGKGRAAYGERLLRQLARDLTAAFGRGFGVSNLKVIRKFYLTYECRCKGQTVSGLLAPPRTGKKTQTVSGFSTASAAGTAGPAEIVPSLPGEFSLSWSHYVRLLSLDEPAKRDFYEEEARRAGWSVRQLDRQINSLLYERLALTSDPHTYEKAGKYRIRVKVIDIFGNNTTQGFDVEVR